MTLTEIRQCTDANTLHTERLNLQNKLKGIDYIGIKIATQRATREDYTEQIADMQECADKINTIDKRISELEKEEVDETDNY